MKNGPPRFLDDPESVGVRLLAALDDEVIFHHPLLSTSLRGRGTVDRFWTSLNDLTGGVVFTHEFRDDRMVVLVWTGSLGRRTFQGVSIASWDGDRIVEILQLLRPLPSLTPLRDALRAHGGEGIPDARWQLPAGVDRTVPAFDPAQPVDAHLPLPTTEDVVFHSPVFDKPVAGEPLVKRVIGHAAAVYGGRNYGPRLVSGSRALTQWAGVVAGLPIHAANLSTLDDRGRIKELSLFMGPLPVVELFFELVRPRLATFLGSEYLEASEATGT
jgi:hypothetical protein